MAEATGDLSSTPPATPPVAPERRLFARLRDRIVASDPAFSRLRLASRAMLSVLINVAILAGITVLLHPLPLAAYGIATILSFMGAIAVRDKAMRDQVVTRGLAALAATAVMLLASLLASRPAIAYAGFMVVIFAAVYIRQYGPRGFFVGMIAFMAYFMGDYLRPQPEQIGWIALTSVIALGATHFVTHVLLTDDPERDFRRAVTTIDRRINLILRKLYEAALHGGLSRAGRADLNDHITRLREIVLMAEGFIPQGRNGPLTGSGPASDLAVTLFDLQLAAERLVSASFRALPPASLSHAVLYFDDPAIAAAADRLDNAPECNETTTEKILVRVHRARQRLAAKLTQRPVEAFAAGQDEETAAGKKPDGRNATHEFIPAIYHLPIQVTLACGIAMGSGLLVSSQRWYWAVIAAFIVFNNTRSRADTALKALSRSAGTLAGVVVGTIVATLLHGAMAGSLVVLTICFFLAYYFLQISYGVMIFFITISLALLYGLMGVFSPELLAVRLAETLVGAVSGAFTAFFIFPKRASSGVSESFDAYLAGFGEFIDAAQERALGKDEDSDIVALSRSLDRKLSDLSNAVRPLGGPWGFVTRYGVVREKLLYLTGCTHWARVLARSLSRGDRPQGDDIARFEKLVGEIHAGIARAEEAKERFFLTPRKKQQTPTPREPRRSLSTREDENPILALEIISTLIDRSLAGAGHTAA